MPLLLLGLGLVVVLAISSSRKSSGGGGGGAPLGTPPVDVPPNVTPPTFATDPTCETAYGMLPPAFQMSAEFRKNTPAANLLTIAKSLDAEGNNPDSMFDGPTRANMIFAADCLRKEAAAKNPTKPLPTTTGTGTTPVVPIPGMKILPGTLDFLAPPSTAPPPVEPAQPTIPGTTLSVPSALPDNRPPYSLGPSGCDADPDFTLAFMFTLALGPTTNVSKDLSEAASLENFAQQLAFCAQSKPTVTRKDGTVFDLMDYATRVGVRAANVRARAAGG